MQHSLKALLGSTMYATDGDLGKVDEFYFDDACSAIRYLVVNTGSPLLGRRVLISVVALETPDWNLHTIPVHLSSDQVRKSPTINTERPVHRQQEIDLHKHYVWPHYWGTGFTSTPRNQLYPLCAFSLTDTTEPERPTVDSHLCSTQQVTGYHIHATDGDIGHVDDFIIDDNNWTIRFLVVNTTNMVSEKRTVISHAYVQGVRWSSDSVYLNISKKAVQKSPAFNPTKILDRDDAGNFLW